MCGIAGFFNPSADYTKEKNYRNHILEMMNKFKSTVGRMMKVRFSPLNAGLPCSSEHHRLSHRTSADETRQRRSQLCHCI